MRFQNWARCAGCTPARFHEPESEEDVAAILARAAAAGERVRAVGGGHSWNDIACCDENLVSLDRMGRVLAVDAAARRVSAEGGIRIRALNERLAAHGLALSNLGSVVEQSIAGAIATGTHGSGARFGSLATQVRALRLVTPAGRTLDLSRERDPELFSAARVSLGALGIVAAATLECEPAFDLEETTEPLAFEDALARMQDLVERNEHVKLWWLPHTDRVQVFRANRTTRPRAGTDGLSRRFAESALLYWIFTGLLRVGTLAPPLVPALNPLVARAHFRRSERVDRSDRVFVVPTRVPRHLESEYAFDRARAPEALRRLRALIEARRLKVNFIVEVRFVAADDILLSPAFGRETCYLGAYCAGDARAYFAAFEELMAELDGRPHWGKAFSLGPARLRALYPGFARFEEIRRELDPRGTLENAYTERVFGARAVTRST